MYRFGVGLFYANSTRFTEEVLALVDGPEPPRWFVMLADAMDDVDFTGGKTLLELAGQLADRNVVLCVAGAGTCDARARAIRGRGRHRGRARLRRRSTRPSPRSTRCRRRPTVGKGSPEPAEARNYDPITVPPDAPSDIATMRFLRRAYQRFLANPSSARYATSVIVIVTIVVVLLGALLMWAFDHKQYESFGEAVWFTLQTVTTVGYGDSTPTSVIGRVVAGAVMLTGIGLITVVTASVTSVFIEAARTRAARSNAEADAKAPHPLDRVEARLAEIAERLERLEAGQRTHDDEPDPP